MTNLILQKAAEADIGDALAWYEEQDQRLPARLISELDAVFERIIENPVQFPVVMQPVRRALLHRFPYSVYFVHSADTVSVLGVVHQKRHPRTWMRRRT